MNAVKQWFDRRRPESDATADGPIGVYFTEDHLHLVQLQRSPEAGLVLRSHKSLKYPGSRREILASSTATGKLIRRALSDGDFVGRNVVSAMPPEHVRVMSLSYPAKSADSAASSIARLMAGRVDGALTDYVVDYLPTRTASRDGDRLALVAVSRLEHANSYLDSLESAGLHVDFLEIGSLAIQRLIESGTATKQYENVIIVNGGQAASHLTTISGNRLLADQEIQFGVERILQSIADTLDLSIDVAKDLVLTNGLDPSCKGPESSDGSFDPDVVRTLVQIVRPEFMRLAREIDRAFLFADSESQAEGDKKIMIVGEIAQWHGVPALLGSLTNLRVEKIGLEHMPFAKDPDVVESIGDREAADMSTAVGLALRGMLTHG
jgi:Tfp pilus assembly PilM family ATPase